MVDLRCSVAGIRSPNPFWLASAPPTDKKYNVERAFRAGWGGAVWKTLGEDPPIVNTCSRYGAVSYNGARVAGFNNIELVTDRPLEDTSHQAVRQVRSDRARRYEVIDEACVGCNLCMHVCPVEGCITVVEIDNRKPPLTWDRHPNNPLRQDAAE